MKTKEKPTIDTKEGGYCVYLITRERVDTYDRLLFFEQNVEETEVSCLKGANNMVGIVQLAKYKDVVSVSLLAAIVFNCALALSTNKLIHMEVSLTL